MGIFARSVPRQLSSDRGRRRLLPRGGRGAPLRPRPFPPQRRHEACPATRRHRGRGGQSRSDRVARLRPWLPAVTRARGEPGPDTGRRQPSPRRVVRRRRDRADPRGAHPLPRARAMGVRALRPRRCRRGAHGRTGLARGAARLARAAGNGSPRLVDPRHATGDPAAPTPAAPPDRPEASAALGWQSQWADHDEAGKGVTVSSAETAERIIEREVRELIRRRGLDPANGGAATVRSLIDEVVADYGERGLTASMPPLDEPELVAKAVADRVVGFGPLQPYLEDPEIEEIWINQPDNVFVAKAGRPLLTSTVLSEQQVHDLVELMLQASGRRLDLSSPFVDATLADGSRLHVVIPDITRRHWAVNVRKFVVRESSLEELVRLGTMTPQCARFLADSVVAGMNTVAAGGNPSAWGTDDCAMARAAAYPASGLADAALSVAAAAACSSSRSSPRRVTWMVAQLACRS